MKGMKAQDCNCNCKLQCNLDNKIVAKIILSALIKSLSTSFKKKIGYYISRNISIHGKRIVPFMAKTFPDISSDFQSKSPF